jgi:hypothetical protein
MALNPVVSIVLGTLISIAITWLANHFSGKKLEKVAEDLRAIGKKTNQTLDIMRKEILALSYALERIEIDGVRLFRVDRNEDGFPTDFTPGFANLRVTTKLTATPSYEPPAEPPPNPDGGAPE